MYAIESVAVIEFIGKWICLFCVCVCCSVPQFQYRSHVVLDVYGVWMKENPANPARNKPLPSSLDAHFRWMKNRREIGLIIGITSHLGFHLLDNYCSSIAWFAMHVYGSMYHVCMASLFYLGPAFVCCVPHARRHFKLVVKSITFFCAMWAYGEHDIASKHK